MSEPTLPSDAADSAGRPPARISGAAVLGFGALGLLWPVLHLSGVESLVGEPATAAIVFLGTLAVWVLGAGFGRVPRPIATLTLSGALFGTLLTAAWLLVDGFPEYGPVLAIVGAVLEVGRAAGLGALAGLVARAIQRRRPL
jgi:hypothetical protein